MKNERFADVKASFRDERQIMATVVQARVFFSCNLTLIKANTSTRERKICDDAVLCYFLVNSFGHFDIRTVLLFYDLCTFVATIPWLCRKMKFKFYDRPS